MRVYYSKRHSDQVSIIASAMKGGPVIRKPNLVLCARPVYTELARVNTIESGFRREQGDEWSCYLTDCQRSYEVSDAFAILLAWR
jgi:hypothetical protein